MESRPTPSTVTASPVTPPITSAAVSRAQPLILCAALSAGFFSSCVDPYNPPPATYEEREASARRLNEIEEQNFRARDRERRSAARAGGYYLDDPANSTSGARPVW